MIYRHGATKSSRANALAAGRAIAGIFPDCATITEGNRIDMQVKSTTWKYLSSILIVMEDMITQRNVCFDHLALAAGLALGLVITLFWCVDVLADQSLPIWYYGLGLVAMTWATYAQLEQGRAQEEA